MKNQIQAVLSAVKNEIKTIRLSFPRNGRPAGFGDLRLTKSLWKKVFSLFKTTNQWKIPHKGTGE